MLTFDQAHSIVINKIDTLDIEEVDLAESLGSYSAGDVISSEDSPGKNRSFPS